MRKSEDWGDGEKENSCQKTSNKDKKKGAVRKAPQPDRGELSKKDTKRPLDAIQLTMSDPDNETTTRIEGYYPVGTYVSPEKT